MISAHAMGLCFIFLCLSLSLSLSPGTHAAPHAPQKEKRKEGKINKTQLRWECHTYRVNPFLNLFFFFSPPSFPFSCQLEYSEFYFYGGEGGKGSGAR